MINNGNARQMKGEGHKIGELQQNSVILCHVREVGVQIGLRTV